MSHAETVKMIFLEHQACYVFPSKTGLPYSPFFTVNFYESPRFYPSYQCARNHLQALRWEASLLIEALARGQV